jgi:hypothetical protein
VQPAGVGQQRHRATQQVGQQLAAVAQVPDALVHRQVDQIAVRPAVRLEVHAGVLHLEDLVQGQRAQRLADRGPYPVDLLTTGRQRLRDEEHRGRELLAHEHRKGVGVHVRETVVEGQCGCSARQPARRIEPGQRLPQRQDLPVAPQPGGLPGERLGLHRQRMVPPLLDRVVAEDRHRALPSSA